MSRLRSIAAAAVVVMTISGAHANGINNVVRDCYARAKIDAPAAAADAEIFVLVDETTVFDDNLKQEAIDRATEFLKDNRSFTVGRFSAFVQGHYADLVVTGKVQKDLTSDQRDGLPRPKVKDFDACHNQQIGEAQQGIGYSMLNLMNGASNEIIRSDIISSLQMFSKAVAASPATRKVVFVVSDMLENSSIASFYEKNGLGTVRDSAISDVEKAKAFGDFGHADIYVLGAATMADKDKQAKNSYHDPKKLEKLEHFWRDWFSRSNGTLVAFGVPALTLSIK